MGRKDETDYESIFKENRGWNLLLSYIFFITKIPLVKEILEDWYNNKFMGTQKLKS